MSTDQEFSPLGTQRIFFGSPYRNWVSFEYEMRLASVSLPMTFVSAALKVPVPINHSDYSQLPTTGARGRPKLTSPLFFLFVSSCD